MLGEIFYWVLNMSIAAAVTGSIVWLIGKLTRLPRRLACLLWVIPYIRMVFPFGIGSRYSLMTFFSGFTTKTVTLISPFEDWVDLSMMNAIMAANSYFPITYKISLLEDLFRIAGCIWLVVFAALLLAFGILYLITVTELKDATHLRDDIYISPKITSPAVYGILKQRILLPDSYDENALPYILAHERAHIKRADNFRRFVAIILTACHWFNPLAWAFLRKYLAETELACDESVLAGFDGDERKAYAKALVTTAENRELFACAFGGAKLRVRVSHILSYKKLSQFSACAFAALAVAVGCVLLTNAAS